MTDATSFFIFRLIFFPILAGSLTWYWEKVSFIYELQAVDTIFFGGLFFSFAIIINTANVRRFNAIDELAKLWAVGMSLWHTVKRELPEDKVEEFQGQLQNFFEEIRFFLHIDTSEEESKKRQAKIDSFFSYLSATVYELRKNGMQSPETACLWRWIEEMSFALEKLIAVKEHRTPKSLRIFIDWAMVTGMLLLTPQFAAFGHYGILLAVILMIILLSLLKVQKMLEHPFGKDIDDIDLRCREKTTRRIV